MMTTTTAQRVARCLVCVIGAFLLATRNAVVVGFSSTVITVLPSMMERHKHNARLVCIRAPGAPGAAKGTAPLYAQRVCLVGNAYLNTLEQQTMAAALKDEATCVYINAEQRSDTVSDASNRKLSPANIWQEITGNIVGDDAKKESLMQQIKQAGKAGIVSFAMVQTGFWSVSFLVALGAYVEVTGHLPDFNDPEEVKKLGAEAFAYVNVARLAAPLRVAFALSSTPWIQKNIIDRLQGSKRGDDSPDDNA